MMPAEKRSPTTTVVGFLHRSLLQLCAILSKLYPRRVQTNMKQPVAAPGGVEVYILLGQSNMLGMGHVGSKDDTAKDGTLQCAVHQKGLYPYLIDKEGHWVTSPSVRNVFVMDAKGGGMHVYHNEFLTIRGDKIGPEIGIGHCLEQATKGEKPILLLKLHRQSEFRVGPVATWISTIQLQGKDVCGLQRQSRCLGPGPTQTRPRQLVCGQAIR